MLELNINGHNYRVDVDPSMPLLWVIREQIGLTGTKFGCGIAQCGACTVHLNGKCIRSCVTPVSAAVGTKVVTIEGIASPEGTLHPIQQAWLDGQVPQCGYCQSGQIMSAVALLDKSRSPTNAEIDNAMSGIICRCGTYTRIRRAIRSVAAAFRNTPDRLDNE